MTATDLAQTTTCPHCGREGVTWHHVGGHSTARIHARRCRDCGRDMRPKGRKADGRTVLHQAHGYCYTCYGYRKIAGTLPAPPVRTYQSVRRCKIGQTCDFCEDIGDLHRLGVSPWDWADRMQTTPINLQRMLYRHRKFDLARKLGSIVNEIRRNRERRVA